MLAVASKSSVWAEGWKGCALTSYTWNNKAIPHWPQSNYIICHNLPIQDGRLHTGGFATSNKIVMGLGPPWEANQLGVFRRRPGMHLTSCLVILNIFWMIINSISISISISTIIIIINIKVGISQFSVAKSGISTPPTKAFCFANPLLTKTSEPVRCHVIQCDRPPKPSLKYLKYCWSSLNPANAHPYGYLTIWPILDTHKEKKWDLWQVCPEIE